MKRLSKRARRPLALALGLAVIASVAGLAAYRQLGSQAHAAAAPASSAAPGSVQSRADLGRMQSLLNSGSVSKQAGLLVPGFRFTAGSKPVFPAGTMVTIEQATFRSAGQFAQVQAEVSGKPEILGLYFTQGHWRLYQVAAGTAQTQASATGPASAQLTAAVQPAQRACTPQTQITGTPVIFIHGFESSPAIWDSMFSMVYAMPGTWTTAFDYSGVSTQWVTNSAIGPAFASYIKCVAQASTAGKVIIVAHSMGGLATRWAAAPKDGGVSQYIGTVITIGTPNTGSFMGNIGTGLYPLACSGSKSRLAMNLPLLTNICEGENAEAGMQAFGPSINSLPELPSGIPLHAIAGNETILLYLGLAQVVAPTFGDVAVLQSSALSPRGGTPYWCVALNTYQGPCWHNALPSNPAVEKQVSGIIRDYIQAHPAPVPAAQGQQPLAGHPAGPDGEDPLNVVYNYYDALNAHDYQRAWELGGSNIAGTSYDSWVAGYAGTKGMYVTGQDLGGGVVQVSITATQADGSVQHYAGTYTVKLTDVMSWTIVTADIHSTSGAAPAPAQPAGGASYWLANGGQWYVHGLQLRISRGGPTSLTGTETWNEFGAVVTGTVHLEFTLQPDGSLRGIYTDDPVYTKTGDASAWPGPSIPSPKGTIIRLVPDGPMHAKVIGGPFGGNTNLCQLGLPNPSQYCGA